MFVSFVLPGVPDVQHTQRCFCTTTMDAAPPAQSLVVMATSISVVDYMLGVMLMLSDKSINSNTVHVPVESIYALVGAVL